MVNKSFDSYRRWCKKCGQLFTASSKHTGICSICRGALVAKCPGCGRFHYHNKIYQYVTGARSYRPVYCLACKGAGLVNVGSHRTIETRLKMSKAHMKLKKPAPPKPKKLHLSAEHKDKISKALKGRKIPRNSRYDPNPDDIYYHTKYLENLIERIKQEVKNAENKKLILDFHEEAVLNGLSMPTQIRRLYNGLWLARRFKKGFMQADKDDIKKVILFLENSDYRIGTKCTYRNFVKQFFAWTGKEDIIDWIQTTSPGRIIRDSLLTHEDIKQLLENCADVSERAMVVMLYCSAGRTSELLGLKKQDITIEGSRITAVLQGKTGRRKIPVIMPREWFDVFRKHYDRIEYPEQRLWRLNYKQFTNILKRIRRGLNKHCHPHLFRHSRSTFLASYLTESQLCVYCGWVMGSKVPAIYVHLSGRDLVPAVERIARIEDSKLAPSLSPNYQICMKGKELDMGQQAAAT